VISLYGNVAVQKVWCPDCGASTFVRDGVKACCGGPVAGEPDRYVRESSPDDERRQIGKRQKERILAEQEGRCFYCGEQFGAIKHRRGEPVTLRVNWDHRMPYAYSQDNRASNYVAACHVCNGIKSDHVFRDLEQAGAHIAAQRRAKGYDF
jgi:hypothetical protein